jgi:hypothetical protein
MGNVGNVAPVVRVVEQFTGRVADTPEQQAEYLRDQNAELTLRNQELQTENGELKRTLRLVISTIENMLQQT